jgi:hypothetical protein
MLLHSRTLHNILVQGTVKLLKSIGQKNVEYPDLINLLLDVNHNATCLLRLKSVSHDFQQIS